MTLIFHITQRAQWEEAQAAGTYRGDTLDSEGFIHSSTASQIAEVANRYFRGESGLVLLHIELEKVQPRVVFEHPIDPETGQPEPGEQFPHIYGPLNVDAIIKAIPFEPNPDGTFSLPAEIESKDES